MYMKKIKDNNKELFLDNNEIWDKKYNQLLEFIKKNHKLPSITAKNREEKQLRSWVNDNKKNYKILYSYLELFLKNKDKFAFCI